MEPHSDKKGRLGGKFEDFSHAPKQDVWARIEADVTPKRKLGAIFGAFTWQPHPRVWRSIAAELHGKGGRRIAAAWWWSAAAGIALVIGLSYFGLDGGNAGGLEGRHPKAFGLARQTKPFSEDAFNAKQLAAQLQAQIRQLSDEKEAAVSQPVPNSPMKGNNQFAGYPIKNNGKDRDQPVLGSENLPQKMVYSPVDKLNPDKIGTLYGHDDNWQRLFEAQRGLEKEDEYQSMLLALNNYGVPEKPEKVKFEGGYEARLGGSLADGGIGASYNAAADFTSLGSGANSTPTPSSIADLSWSNQKNEEYTTPIVIGGFVNKGIRKRVDLGIGLVYTRMNSTSEYGILNQSKTEKITRQYLGLASNVYYDFVERKHLNLYLTAGTQLDFGLGKTTELSTNVNSQPAAVQTQKESAGNQLGFNGGLGLNYMLTKHIGAFGQGSLSTFPWQSSGNLYSTKRFWPMAQVGLRLKL